jgi:hypothetical protein
MDISLRFQAFANMLRDVLQGEPLRAIVYGAAVVVWLVTHIAKALNFDNFQVVDFDAAMLAATAAAAMLTELARRYVYSPATVNAIIASQDTTDVSAGDAPTDTPADAPAPADSTTPEGSG